MGNQINKILRSVAAETLEGLAFVFALPAESIDEIDYDSLIVANVTFVGVFSGTLIAIVSREILPGLAGNMLGVESEDAVSLDQQQDALKELLNVICGNLLPALAGDREIFHISVPGIIDRDEIASNTQGLALSGAARLELDEGYVNLFLYSQDKIPVSNGNESP